MKLLTLVFIAILVLPATALALGNTDLKVQILPLDCLFEVVNDGSNTIHYLTPAECGQLTPPPPNPAPAPINPITNQPPSSTTNSFSQANVVQDTAPTIVDNGVQIIGLPIEPEAKSQPPKPDNFPILALTAAGVLLLIALIIDNFFEFGLIQLINKIYLKIGRLASTIFKHRFRG